MGLSLKAICEFLWLSFKMSRICSQYVNERLSSGRKGAKKKKSCLLTQGQHTKTVMLKFVSFFSVLVHHRLVTGKPSDMES